MAELTFTIPDNIVARTLDGVAYQLGYTDTIKDAEGADIPNPQTKLQYVRARTLGFWKECVVAYEAKLAADAARNTAIDTANQEINL